MAETASVAPLDQRWRLELVKWRRWRSTRQLEWLGVARLLDVERRGRLDRRWQLELAERRRRRLELVDWRANLSNSSKEDATRCLVWLGDLVDAKKLGGSAAGSDTLLLPVVGMATAGPKTQCTMLMHM
ncbi:uncharacterized protein LOC125546973 [Triticum urartu]|uniref:uncharacterized protein LOC125546973 n=1 Tax=Triticum urartu TaxID=4572 RepID=UPI0020438CF8|nr:uncharacterized protein LOC125546973 [Triticum urartu]